MIDYCHFEMTALKFWGVIVFLKRDFHTHILLSAKKLSLRNDIWLSFWNEQFRNLLSFRYDIWLSFRNDRAKFWNTPVENSGRSGKAVWLSFSNEGWKFWSAKIFSSGDDSHTLVTKIPIKHINPIFLYTDFTAAGGPCTALKYKISKKGEKSYVRF